MSNSRVIVIYGLPGAGKTTLAKQIEHYLQDSLRISNDEERIRLGIAPRGRKTDLVYESALRKALAAMLEEKTVLLDATFYRRKYRAMFLQSFRHARASSLLLEIVTPMRVCRDRVRKRKDHISGLGGEDLDKFDRLYSIYSPWDIHEDRCWLSQTRIVGRDNRWRLVGGADSLRQPIWSDIYDLLRS